MQGMADWAAPDRHDGPVQAKCKMAADEHRPGEEPTFLPASFMRPRYGAA